MNRTDLQNLRKELRNSLRAVFAHVTVDTTLATVGKLVLNAKFLHALHLAVLIQMHVKK